MISLSDTETTNNKTNFQVYTNTGATCNIAIVGVGPKGLYGFERLLANIKSNPIGFPIHIHLFNRNAYFGAGDIYRPDQPYYLLMNYASKHINIWTDQLPEAVVPQRKSFLEWVKDNPVEEAFCDPNSYAPRALVGKYLTWGFQSLIKHCPEQVHIHLHADTVEKIEPRENDYAISTKKELPLPNRFHHVLIATGHRKPTKRAYRKSSKFVPFVFPIQEKLDLVKSKSTVAIKGMGLTFIDTVLGLTEGRGGTFEQLPHGEMRYLRSGNEPSKIYPYSRSGSPIIPRTANENVASSDRFFFNKKTLDLLPRDSDGQLDFDHQLLPLIKQEFEFDYYSKLFNKYGYYIVPDNYTSVKSQIDEFHKNHPYVPYFDFEELLQPFRAFASVDDKQYRLYLDYILEEAKLGSTVSPFASACATWRALSSSFNEVYSFGGLSPLSQAGFDKKYAGDLNRIAYGPPLQNMYKIKAVAEAGILDFSFAKNPDFKNYNFTQFSFAKDGQRMSIDYWIDARIPKNNIKSDTNAVYSSMLKNGLISIFSNDNSKGEQYQPGCLALDLQGHPVAQSGESDQRILFAGTPTEGVTFDNDTLSRHRNDFTSQWAKKLIKKLETTNK